MSSNVENRASLLPVSVPWQVSASAAFLRVDEHEFKQQRIIAIDFVGFFGGYEWPPERHYGTEVLVVDPPPDFEEDRGGVTSKYHQVRIVFEGVEAFRLLPAISESKTFDDSAYDWSAVPEGLLPGEGLRENLERVHRTWISHRVCPNPRMYEVVPSSWKKELGLQEHTLLKHCLIAGTDEFVEILAQSWKWMLGTAVQ